MLVLQVIKNYGMTLKKGMRHSALALSRMLSLWLEFADVQVQAYGGVGVPGANGHGARLATSANPEREERCHTQMEQLVAQAPIYQWLPEVAQLVSRTAHANQRVRNLIHALLSSLLANHPCQLSWWIVPAALSTVPDRRRHGESIVGAARLKLHSDGGSEILAVAKRLIDRLRHVCNDNSMEKREKHIRMSARWSALHRMQRLPLVIPTHANLTAAPPDGDGAMRDYEPFSESSVTIESWDDEGESAAGFQPAPPKARSRPKGAPRPAKGAPRPTQRGTSPPPPPPVGPAAPCLTPAERSAWLNRH